MPFLANIKYCPEFLEYSLPDTFPEKVIPGINFMDEAVVQCYVPVVQLQVDTFGGFMCSIWTQFCI